MPILLIFIAALAGGGHECQHIDNNWVCDVLPRQVADSRDLQQVSNPQHIARPTPSPKAAIPAEPSASAELAAPATPESDTAPETPAEQSTQMAVAMLNRGWAVQIAAFGDRAAAELGVQRIGRDNLEIVHTRRDGEDWFVLLLGIYPSHEEADRAGRAYAEESGGSYWVRNAAALGRPPAS